MGIFVINRGTGDGYFCDMMGKQVGEKLENKDVRTTCLEKGLKVVLISIFASVFILMLHSCNQVQKISDIFVQPTDRERYERMFDENDPRLAAWNRATQTALADTLSISLPYAETGVFPSEFNFAYGYDVPLQNGRKLMVSVTPISDSIGAFVDVYQLRNERENEPLLSKEVNGAGDIVLPIEETGIYKIVVQPKIGYSTAFRLDIYSEPTLLFPVLGAANRNIQSFWGDARAGGTRLHQGVDIFAPRATPVVAVKTGRVSFTGERGLGGKQVWFRDGLFNHSFYYAHLDSVKVSFAQKVEAGDTLGFVGNTGNARTTLPHLHFGIYGSNGAIDPLPFIQKGQRTERALKTPLPYGHIGAELANVRKGPTVETEIIRSLKKERPVFILGKTANWYHVLFDDNIQGYVYHTLINESEEAAD